MQPIYLDNQATTCLDPRVFDAMKPYFLEHYGNAASKTHAFGKTAADAVADCREELAALLGAHPLGIVFTSGATEANNLGLKGLASFYGDRKRHVITATTEHPAVLDICGHLETLGFSITRLPVNSSGHIDLEQLRAAIRTDTLAVSLMPVNNETGVIHDTAAIGALCKEKGVFFHCDAAQALGKTAIRIDEMGIDLLSVSAHKFYGPKGMGLLYVRRKQPRVRLATQMHGGGHERNFRSGTLNVPGIVGLTAALRLALADLEQENQRLLELRNRFLAGLKAAGAAPILNGDALQRDPGNLNLRFPGVDSGALLRALPQIAASRGSACSSAVPSPSKVLLAMGLTAQEASESVRFSLGRFNTTEDIERATVAIAGAAASLAGSSAAENMESCEL